MVIVAAVDRSERAGAVIREAKALAEAFDEPVHIVHVLTRSDFVDLGRTKAQEGDRIDMDEIRDVAENIAAEAAARLDIPLKTVGLVGEPETQIIKYAAEHNARYVVVATRKQSPAGKAIFGSVAQSVILNSECPVVTTVEP